MLLSFTCFTYDSSVRAPALPERSRNTHLQHCACDVCLKLFSNVMGHEHFERALYLKRIGSYWIETFFFLSPDIQWVLLHVLKALCCLLCCFTSLLTLLVLFPTYLHTNKTICPSIPLLGSALKNASVSIRKCTQYHVLQVISPRMWFTFSLPLPARFPQTHTHSAHTLYMRACMPMCFIYRSAEQTTCCVSLVSCVMMMKGTCCSQQKPLSTLCYWHPACIIHKSSGNSVTSQRHSTSVTWAERKRRRGSVDSCPYVTFLQRENEAIMWTTS